MTALLTLILLTYPPLADWFIRHEQAEYAVYLLALFASLEAWSLFANILSYVLIASLFMAEYFFRRWHLRSLVDYSFSDFIKGIIRLDYARIFRGS